MTSNASFIRKVAYIVAIALLLVPLSIMSRPTVVRKDSQGRYDRQVGGVLAEMRDEAELSQAQLGQIDPASATMKLATFGLRGVAVVMLWNNAGEYKKKEDWDNFSATLEQIARLQPNFVTVWEHQAHNMTYNTSVEFDDYRQRYHWVKKGIDYLIAGTEYNRNEPRLLWYAGWVIGQKIGRADERVQFRRLYREDHEFHNLLGRQGIALERAIGDQGPDNWLMGSLWYEKAQQVADNGASIGSKSPAIFHQSPIKSLMNYCEDTEKELEFDAERLQNQWRQAHNDWETKFGARQLDSSSGFKIQLGSRPVEELEHEIEDLTKKLDDLLPRIREEIRQEKIAALTADKRKAWEKPASERSTSDQIKASEAEFAIKASSHEVAGRAPPAVTIQARRIASQLATAEEKLRLTLISRSIVHYEFWRDRAQAGATDLNSAARKNMAEGIRLFTKPDLERAREKLETSFKQWAEIHEKWPILKGDAENMAIVEAVETYIKVLEQLDQRDENGGILPPDFPLADLMKEYDKSDLLKFREDHKTEADPKKTDDAPQDPPPDSST